MPLDTAIPRRLEAGLRCSPPPLSRGARPYPWALCHADNSGERPPAACRSARPRAAPGGSRPRAAAALRRERGASGRRFLRPRPRNVISVTEGGAVIFTRGQRQPRVCVGTAAGGGGREAPRTWPCRARFLPRASPCRLSPAMPSLPIPAGGQAARFMGKTAGSAHAAHCPPRAPTPAALLLAIVLLQPPLAAPLPPPRRRKGTAGTARRPGRSDPRSHGTLLQPRRRSLPTRLPCGAQTCRSLQRLHPALQESHRSRKGPAALRSRALMAMAGEGLFRESLS